MPYNVDIIEGRLAEKHYSGDAGYDLFTMDSVTLTPEHPQALVDTGLALSMPFQLFAIVMPRSSISNLEVLGHTGIIDQDYKNRIKVCLRNLGKETLHFKKGDRVAQLVFFERLNISFTTGRECQINDGERGNRGFGSTGR